METRKRNKLLFDVGVALTFLFVIFLISYVLCRQPLSELCIWLKPFKFSISFAIYVFTLGWLMEYLKPILGEKRIQLVSILITCLIIVEMTVIFLESLMMSQSYAHMHLLTGTTERIMWWLNLIGNVVILMNTAVAIYVGMQFFRDIPLTPSAYLFGIRTGFLVFTLSCALGVILLHRYGQSPPDHESFGFPFTHFSSLKSDLVSLHFTGIHYLQLLPLCGYFFKEWLAYAVILLFCGSYLGCFLFFLYKVI